MRTPKTAVEPVLPRVMVNLPDNLNFVDDAAVKTAAKAKGWVPFTNQVNGEHGFYIPEVPDSVVYASWKRGISMLSRADAWLYERGKQVPRSLSQRLSDQDANPDFEVEEERRWKKEAALKAESKAEQERSLGDEEQWRLAKEKAKANVAHSMLEKETEEARKLQEVRARTLERRRAKEDRDRAAAVLEARQRQQKAAFKRDKEEAVAQAAAVVEAAAKAVEQVVQYNLLQAPLHSAQASAAGGSGGHSKTLTSSTDLAVEQVGQHSALQSPPDSPPAVAAGRPGGYSKSSTSSSDLHAVARRFR